MDAYSKEDDLIGKQGKGPMTVVIICINLQLHFLSAESITLESITSETKFTFNEKPMK